MVKECSPSLNQRVKPAMHSITLRSDERQTLLDYLRRHPDPQLRLRAHIILLLADGHTWATMVAELYSSSRTIVRCQQRYQQARVPALLGLAPGAPRRLA